MRNYERLRRCQHNSTVSQLFGGVGTMAAFNGRGHKLIELFSKTNLKILKYLGIVVETGLLKFYLLLLLLRVALEKLQMKSLSLIKMRLEKFQNRLLRENWELYYAP